MDDRRRALLAELYQEGRGVDAAEPDRLRRRRNLEPESAAFLRLLVLAVRPASLLELGTSNGYSTIWLADACAVTGTTFRTVENNPGRAAEAATNLGAAGVAAVVDQQVGDAAQALAAAHDGEWSMIFLDAERSAYAGYWPQLRRVLAPGGLLVVDNCVSHADQVAEFRELVESSEGFESVLLTVGAGLLLITRAAAPTAGV